MFVTKAKSLLKSCSTSDKAW